MRLEKFILRYAVYRLLISVKMKILQIYLVSTLFLQKQ